MDAIFTPEETKLIWDALRDSEPQRCAEAMRIVASELRRVGVFPPLPPLFRHHE